jgi:hypothetical protein
MHRLRLLLLATMAASPALFLQSCKDDAADCQSVCTRWKDCAQSSYDAAACQTKCEDRAGKDRDFDAQLNHCAECIEARSCSETAANCIASCVGIVP